MSSYSDPDQVLNRLVTSAEECALVCITDINGGTLRAKGALMGVTQHGSFGYISSGCVDADIMFQAREALKDGEVRQLRYGEGSPFKDIRLPCGGSIDVTIIPGPNKSDLQNCLDKLQTRQKGRLKIASIDHVYQPRLRIRIVGRGAPFESLVRLGHASGFDIIGQSPDADLGADLNGEMFNQFDHLKDPARPPMQTDDPYTAVVFLFHDHDWEPALLQQALEGRLST